MNQNPTLKSELIPSSFELILSRLNFDLIQTLELREGIVRFSFRLSNSHVPNMA